MRRHHHGSGLGALSARTRKSLADVTRRKGRTALVVLGIFIAVAGLTGINMSESTLYNAFLFSSGANATAPDIILAVSRLDPSLQRQLASQPNVAALQYQTQFESFWMTGATTKTLIRVVSYPDLRHSAMTPFQLTSGRYPGGGEIVMESGDTALHLFALGQLVTLQTAYGVAHLRVVGIARTPGQDPGGSGEALAYMSDAGLAPLAAGAGSGGVPGKRPPTLDHLILVKVHHRGQEQATAADLQQVLESHQITVLNVGIPDVNANAATLHAVESVFALLRLLAIIAVLLSAVLLVNVTTALVAEQIPVIGIMKAAGGTGGVIMRGYLLSVAIYSALGTVPGLALGLYAGYQLAIAVASGSQLDVGPFALQPWIVGFGLAVGLAVPLLASLPPLGNGTRITVREATSGHGVSGPGTLGIAGGALQQVGARLTGGLTWASRTTQLGLFGLFRRRSRLLLSVLTLAVAAMSFLVVQISVSSVSGTVAAIDAHSSADMEVYFDDTSLYGQLSHQLGSLPNLERIERYAGGNVSTAWGTLEIMGYEPDTRIYHYQLTSGRWLRADDTNVVLLSDAAAVRTGLHVGDTVLVNGRTPLRVIGTLKQTISVLGWIGAAVTSVTTLNQLQGIPAAGSRAGATHEVVIGARDRSRSAVDQLAQKVNQLLNPSDGYADGTGYFSGSRGSIDTTHEYVSRRQRGWVVLYSMLYAIALLVGVTGLLGLVQARAASALERRREIGTLRAIGASSWRVGQVFWVEGMAEAGLAWCLGSLAGVPLAYGFVKVLSQTVMPLNVEIDVSAFLVMAGATLLIASLASIVPAWSASHQRTATLLRYE